MPEADDDQLAALRRVRAAFGPIEVVEVIGHDPAAAPDDAIEDGGPAADDPGGARATILTGKPRARPLDDLMRKLLVVHRLLEAEERLAKREPM